MKVRAIRKHSNGHGDSFVKNPRKIYDAGRDSERLVELGLVEPVTSDPDDDGQG